MSAASLNASRRGAFPLWLPVAAALGLGLAAWLLAEGDVRDYLRFEVPPGQLAYVVGKLAGLTGAGLLTAQLALALARGVPWFGQRFSWSRRQHVLLGVLTVSTIVAHISLYLYAATMRTGQLALPMLLPVFGHDPYRDGLSLGAVALVALCVAVPCGALLARRAGLAAGRLLHHLSLPALLLAVAHAVVIGSEKATVYLLAACAAGVVILLAAGRRAPGRQSPVPRPHPPR